MNIEIANRLFELRKQKNLSQEELAEKIGVSRQAVSKWERAESSPDTDNLIQLARLYSVSLDKLLFTDESLNNEFSSDNKVKSEYVSIGFDGIHFIEKDGTEFHLDGEGIRSKEAASDFHFSYTMLGLGGLKTFLLVFLVPIIIIAIYLLLGFVFTWWHPGWFIFLLIPIYYCFLVSFVAKKYRIKLE